MIIRRALAIGALGLLLTAPLLHGQGRAAISRLSTWR